MVPVLQKFYESLKTLRSDINKVTTVHVAKKTLKQRAGELAEEWFTNISPKLAKFTILATPTIESYSAWFFKLLKLTKANNRKASYIEALTAVTKSFHDDLLLPIQVQPKLAEEVSLLAKLFDKMPNPEEDAYMKEAIACATHQLFRGSAVLGWSAAVDRVHRVIEKTGFDKFNAVSRSMAAATTGRFKRFSKAANITSIGELREYFDGDILWVLEGMGLLESNQNTRLRACYEMRCQCSHPGEAPITEYNLLSFFSDIDQIIFKNSKFAI
jgi:hypothetical protein